MAAQVLKHQGFVDAFEQHGSDLNQGAPQWLVKLRRAAIEKFATVGFPTQRDEDWKFTSTQPVANVQWEPAAPSASDPGWKKSFLPDLGGRLVFVDGRFAADASEIPKGVTVGSLRDQWGSSIVEQCHAPFLDAVTNPFSLLNKAFFRDGAFVHVKKGVALEKPIQFLHIGTNRANTFASPRHLVVAEPGSRAAFLESYIMAGGSPALTIAVANYFVGDDAAIDVTRVQSESRAALHAGQTGISLGRGARAKHTAINIGGAWVRNEVDAKFEGEGGELTMNGLFLGRGTQHVDNQTRVDHAVPRCTSSQFYKGILDEKARGVFRGLVWIRPDAQKTNASQSNKNLLLSREALVDSIPALDIRADDVKASHGSTIGQLEAEPLFYLRSRGIGEDEARALLTHAFAAQILGGIAFAPLRERLDKLVMEWLPRTQEAAASHSARLTPAPKRGA